MAAGSLSPSCFAKKKVVQGWLVILFCSMLNKVFYHPLSERMLSQGSRSVLMLQSLDPGNKLILREVCRCRTSFHSHFLNFQLVCKM